MSNNFIWGDFINEKVVEEVVDFYNNQDMLKYKIECIYLFYEVNFILWMNDVLKKNGIFLNTFENIDLEIKFKTIEDRSR